jgi:hypothetical protein
MLRQVVDFWAFSTEKWGAEIMSMHHTRNALQYFTPKVRTLFQSCWPVAAC